MPLGLPVVPDENTIAATSAGLWPVHRDVEGCRCRDDVAVVRLGAAACAEADAPDRAAGCGDRRGRLGFEIFVMHQDLGFEPVERLAQSLRRLAHMKAAGDPSAQGSCEPRHRMPGRTAAEIGDHLSRPGTVIGKALRHCKRLIERVCAGDTVLFVDEQLVAPAPRGRADEQVAQGLDEGRAQHGKILSRRDGPAGYKAAADPVHPGQPLRVLNIAHLQGVPAKCRIQQNQNP